MADNVSVTPGSGAQISTELLTMLNGMVVTAQHAQRIILATRVSDGVGIDVGAANPLPAELVSGLMASDEKIGLTGREAELISPVSAISVAPYTAGDYFTNPITITNAVARTGGTSTMTQLLLVDLENKLLALKVMIWSAALLGTYTANNAPATINSADPPKLIGWVDVPAANWVTFTGWGFSAQFITGLNIKVQGDGSKNIIFLPLLTAGTPDYTATTSFLIRPGFDKD